MKTTLSLVILFVLSFQKIYSQDTIVKGNGDLILAKITEITVSEVKYKKINFLDGPTYVEKKSDIEMIKYSNGLKEHFEKQSSVSSSSNNNKQDNTVDYYGNPAPIVHNNSDNKIYEFGSRYRYDNRIIGEREMQNMLMNTKDKNIMGLTENAKQAKGLQYIGFGGIIFGTAAFIFLVNSGLSSTAAQSSNSLKAAGACAIIAVSCPIASGIFRANRRRYNSDAINLYNQKY